MLGKDPLMRAEVRRLVSWFNQKFHVEVTAPLVGEKALKHLTGAGEPDSAFIRMGAHNIHGHLDYIAWLTERRNWLAGDEISIADLAAGAQISLIDYLGDVPWNQHQLAKEWYARLKSRPAFRGLLGDHIAGFPPPRIMRISISESFPMLNDYRLAPLNGGTPDRAVIFLHGLGDSGAGGLLEIGRMWQRALPTTEFLCPDAPFALEMAPPGFTGRQWFRLQTFSPDEILTGAKQATPHLNAYIDHVLATRTFESEPAGAGRIFTRHNHVALCRATSGRTSRMRCRLFGFPDWRRNFSG